MISLDEEPFDPMKSLALNYLLAAAPYVAEHLHIQDAVEILRYVTLLPGKEDMSMQTFVGGWISDLIQTLRDLFGGA